MKRFVVATIHSTSDKDIIEYYRDRDEIVSAENEAEAIAKYIKVKGTYWLQQCERKYVKVIGEPDERDRFLYPGETRKRYLMNLSETDVFCAGCKFFEGHCTRKHSEVNYDDRTMCMVSK